MKALAASILVLLALLLGAVELSWTVSNHAMEGAAIARSGSRVARVYMLDTERAVRPYGHGVYVGSRFLPFSWNSTLVFAAYCKPHVRLHWRSATELEIRCVVQEGSAELLPAPAGITVIHVANET